ncbi:MAG: hypothetical protein ACLQGP_20315 [Isosphaeraceae bacterium]
MPLLAIPQPENPRDPKAIGLWVQGKTRRHQIGFIKSELAEELGEHLNQGAALTVRVLEVTGGGKGKDLGVNIEITIHGIPADAPVQIHKHVVEHVYVEPRTRKQGGCLSSCGSLGCLIATGTIIGLAVMIMWTPRSQKPIAPNVAPAPIRTPDVRIPPVPDVASAPSRQPAPKWSASIGETGKLGYANGSDGAVWLALEESAWNDMLDAQNAQSLGALARLARAGKVKAYPVGTKVRVIHSGIVSRKVIVLDGEDSGDMGWVQVEFVLPLRPTEQPTKKISPAKPPASNQPF